MSQQAHSILLCQDLKVVVIGCLKVNPEFQDWHDNVVWPTAAQYLCLCVA